MDFFSLPGTSQPVIKNCRICKQDVGNEYEPSGIRRDNILKLISNIMTVDEFVQPCVVCLECLRRLIIKKISYKWKIIVKERKDKPINIINTSLSEKQIVAKDLMFSLMHEADILHDKIDKLIGDEDLSIISGQRDMEEVNLVDLPLTSNYPTFENVPELTDMPIFINDEFNIEGEQDVRTENLNAGDVQLLNIPEQRETEEVNLLDLPLTSNYPTFENVPELTDMPMFMNDEFIIEGEQDVRTENLNAGDVQLLNIPEQRETEVPNLSDLPSTSNNQTFVNLTQTSALNLIVNDGDEDIIIIPEQRVEELNLSDLPSTSNNQTFENLTQTSALNLIVNEGEAEVQPENTNTGDEELIIIHERHEMEEPSLFDFSSTSNYQPYEIFTQLTPLNLIANDDCIVEGEPDVQPQNTNTGDVQLLILPEQLVTEELNLLDLPSTSNNPAIEIVPQPMDMAIPVDIVMNNEALGNTAEGASRAVAPLRKPRHPRKEFSCILCSICKKVFKYKGVLKKHEATHMAKKK